VGALYWVLVEGAFPPDAGVPLCHTLHGLQGPGLNCHTQAGSSYPFGKTMSSQSQRLGACPRCGEEIRHGHVLIEYDVGKGTEYWVECPGCGEVVAPEI
jgi:predicted RNA-binding Zn-ribbon protein involved in translation (DUF1610 family)